MWWICWADIILYPQVWTCDAQQLQPLFLQADLVALKTRAAELDQEILLREAEAASQQEQFLAKDDREAV